MLIVCSLAVLVGTGVAQSDEPKSKTGVKAKPQSSEPADELDSLLDEGDKGLKFRLVTADDPARSLSEVLYWRTHAGTVAAHTTPVKFRCGGVDVIAPVLNESPDPDDKATYSYPTEAFAKVEAGRHTLTPGNIPLEVKAGTAVSNHPAIQVKGNEVRILCAPVKLQIVDSKGLAHPGSIKLAGEKGSLLREDANFSVLVLWLPIGGDYQTSLGRFQVTADGKLKTLKSQLSPGVEVTEDGLRKTLPAETSPTAVAASNPTLNLQVRQPPADPKSTVPGVEIRFPIYVTAMADADRKVWIAVSRKQYELNTEIKFDAGQFSYRLGEPRPDENGPLKWLPVAAGQPTDTKLADLASAALGTKVGDLAWVSVTIPQQIVGPTRLSLVSEKTYGASAMILAIDAEKIHLVPHRWRTAFTSSDSAAPYTVLVGRGAAAGKAQVWLQSTTSKDDKPLSLGTVELPAVAESDFDSRLFTVDMSRVPVGEYRLWVAAGETRSNAMPVKVVSWLPRSPFFAHSMSGCTGSWPTSDEGLQMLFDAGLEMVTATGFQSQLNTVMPTIDRPLAQMLASQNKLPVELALAPSRNDRFLDRLMHYPLRLVDLAVLRGPSMYLESLSYHHSYKPSVDRMIRNMQLYTQQTTEYPSFWGVNYSWFPALFGYAEGGVPTDAHVGDRNQALAEAVHAAGFKDITPEERKFIDEHKFSTDPAKRDEAQKLICRALEVHNAYNDLGWGKHNKLYNDAIRAIRPNTVCTLFENAGHNESKRLSAMFNDMNAVCYESYTDFGDWPLSSAFVTDWSKGNSPGQPVWLTTCWGASSESKMRSLLHSFVRGMEGGGVPLQESYGMRELARRGMGVKFLSQYGALTTHAVPDRRVAVMWRGANVFSSRAMWQTHAMYCHLTRLGWPPIILCDEFLPKTGIPTEVELIVLANQQSPIEPETREALAKFIKRGGKIITAGEMPEPIPGATHIDQPLKHLWELGGFERHSHEAMWKEFNDVWGPALSKAMADLKLPPYATVEPGMGFAAAMNAGPVRYVAVISEVKNAHADAFEPNPELAISLEGTGWIVRDLARQQDLPTTKQDDRTATKVELVTEPTALLALYKSPPAAIGVEVAPALRLGGQFVATAKVTAKDKSDLGGVPIRVQLFAPDGMIREDVYRAAGDAVSFPLAALDRVGNWKYTVQELLTGLTTTVDVAVAAATEAPVVVRQVPKVQVVEPQHLAAFAARKSPKWVIVEPEQAELLPVAQKLVDTLVAAGADARLWQVQPEQFDTIPVRWYPTEFDEQRLSDIAAGKLIGVRQGLKPYIDKLKRQHVPSKGGYEETSPVYMVGEDCIVFSGGKLAESLRGVTAWMNTPNVPGRGQGRLVTTFSSFMANRQAVAVVANDATGFAEAATALAGAFQKPVVVKATPPVKSERPMLQNVALTRAEPQPVDRPYTNFTPVQRVVQMVANRAGQAAVILRGKQDNIALVDADGKVTATLRDPEVNTTYLQIDDRGTVHFPVTNPLARDQWGGATLMQVLLRSIGPNGQLARELVAYEGSPGVPDYLGGIRVAPDGQALALGRAGGMLLKASKEGAPQRYDDVPNTSTRFSMINPRHPVGGVFSPDGRYVLFTMDSRPNFGGMGGPTSRPAASDTILLDTQTGERVWGLRAAGDFSASTYAVHTGFAAVGRDAQLTAIADFDGTIHLIDKQGKTLLSESITKNNQNTSRLGPTDGVAVVMSDKGETVVFGFSKQLVIARGTELTRVPVAGLDSLAVSADGALIAVAIDGGDVLALDAAGKTLWTVQPGGVKSLVAVGGGAVLAANTLGELVAFDAGGKELRRTNVAAAVDKGVHPLDVADGAAGHPWADYVEPGTLEAAQKLLAAKKFAEWQPQGASQSLYGRKFHSTSEPISLSGGNQQEFFVHLVYRRPEENKSLTIQTKGRDGQEAFTLDLPTPEYRVVDIPVRGPDAEVKLVTDGPVQIAEMSLWSIRWPGANLAYVRAVNPEDSNKQQSGTAAESGLDDILGDVTGEPTNVGKMKKCRIWWPNTDVDQIRGPWIPPVVDPYQMVNNQRFGNGKLRPWCDKWGIYPASRGGFLTIDFEETITPSLAATYDRASKQSELTVNLSLFTFDAEEPLIGGSALAGAVHNDQFWRLYPLAKPKLSALGVHVIKDAASAAGLSEVEVYK